MELPTYFSNKRLFVLPAMAVLLLGPIFAESAPTTDDTSIVDFTVVIEASSSLRSILERALDIRRWRGSRFVTRPLLDELLVDALKQAREVAATEGYFGATVDGEIDSSVQPQVVRIRVNPGQAARIASVTLDFTGPVASDNASAARLSGIRANWRLPVGAVFRQEDWTRAIETALNQLASVSYASAIVASTRAKVDKTLQSVDLYVEIESGPAFFFGPVTTVGLARYSPSIVDRLAPFDPGAPFSRELLRRFERRLVLTGYFSSAMAIIDADPGALTVGPVHAGLNLYNNGFAAGLVAAVLVPVIIAIQTITQPEREPPGATGASPVPADSRVKDQKRN